MNKKTFRSAALSTMAASAAVAAAAPAVSAEDVSFSDLNQDNPHHDAVVNLVEQGAIQGYDDNSFKPFKDVNRGQAAKILSKALDLEQPDNTAEVLDQYYDVDANSDYAGYIAAVTKAGIFAGNGDNAFDIWGHTNREQMAKVIVKAFDLQKYDTGEDVDLNTAGISPDFVPYVQTLANLGITDQLDDYDSWTYVPRDQFSSFVVRAQDAQSENAPALKDVDGTVNDGDTFTIKGTATGIADAAHLIITDASGEKVVDNTDISVDEDDGSFSFTTDELDDGSYSYSIMSMANGNDNTENAVSDKFEIEPLQADNVEAIDANTLKVELNKPVSLQKDDFNVTKGQVHANIDNVRIAASQKSALIDLTSKMTDGEYTVTVDPGNRDAVEGSVQIENEAVANINVLSDIAPIANNNNQEATAAYQITNQYGTDVTQEYGSSLETEVSGAADSADLNPDGTLDLHLTNDAEVGDSVHITLIDDSTGESVTQDLQLSQESKAADVTFGDLYNQDGKTLAQDSDLDDDTFYLPIEAEDQYGEAITDAEKANNDLIITNTNQDIAQFAGDESNKIKEVTINGQDKLALEVTDVDDYGDDDVLAIAKTTGHKAQTSVHVAEGTKADSMSIQAPSDQVTAGEDAYFPLTITDTDGNAVTTKSQLNDLGGSVKSSIGSIQEKDDGLYVKVDGSNLTANKPLTVAVTSGSAEPATQTVTPEAEAVPEVVTGLDGDVDTSVRAKEGSSVEINADDVTVQDQYGRTLSNDKLMNLLNDGYAIQASVDDDAPVTVSGNIADADNSIKVAYSNDSASSAEVNFTLQKDGSSIAGSTFAQTFNVLSNDAFASYNVQDIDDAVYQEDAATKAQGDHREEVAVNAQTDQGKTVKLDNDEFTVKSDDLTIEEDGGKTYITGVDENTFNDSLDGGKTITRDVTVTINATGETFTKEVTVSNAEPEAAELDVRQDGNPDNDVKDQIDITGGTIDSSSVADDLYAEDQYGAQMENLGDIDLTFSNLKSDNATIHHNGKSNAKITGLEKGDSVQVKVETGKAAASVKAVASTNQIMLTGSANTEAGNQMDDVNIDEIEVEATYPDDQEYEAEIEHESDGYTSELKNDKANKLLKGQEAFDEVYQHVKDLDINTNSEKQEVLDEVTQAFDLDSDYDKIEVEISFDDTNEEMEYEENK